MKNSKPFVISAGDPAGIGPDIIASLANENLAQRVLVCGDAGVIQDRAKLLNIDLALLKHKLEFLHHPLKHAVTPGKADPCHADYILRCLETATDLCLKHDAQALITAPINKETINAAGFAFTGHTEFLATYCKTDKTIMLFVTPQHKLALLTTHLPLSKVAQAITADTFTLTLKLLVRELQVKFNITQPHIGVCGLNPHAGEGGVLGREEINILAPVIQSLNQQRFNITGPLPADTIFLPRQKSFDVILSMYHDQSLPVIKTLAFEEAVNVTLGLPIIRTSVDHGTAYSLAGTKKTSSKNMLAALRLAFNLAGVNSL